jgi:hypothetical protein
MPQKCSLHLTYTVQDVAKTLKYLASDELEGEKPEKQEW